MKFTKASLGFFLLWLPSNALSIADSADKAAHARRSAVQEERTTQNRSDKHVRLPEYSSSPLAVHGAWVDDDYMAELLARASPLSFRLQDAKLRHSATSPLRSAWLLPLVLLLGFASFFVGGRLEPMIPKGRALSIALCAVYVTYSISIDVLIKFMSDKEPRADESLFSFNPICAIIVTEAAKIVLSLILHVVAHNGQANLEFTKVTVVDVKWLFVPACLFTLNNLLVYVAIGSNDLSVFAIIRDSIVLWTAIQWRLVYDVPLGAIRMCSIAAILFGLMMQQAISFNSKGHLSWACLWVLSMTFCNSTGSVTNEYAMKRNKALDINLQNSILYAMCVAFSFCLLAATAPKHLKGIDPFFEGFTKLTWATVGLNAVGGLIISRLLKYTDSVTKTASACSRGPLIVLSAPFLMATSLSLPVFASAVIVACGSFCFVVQGSMGAEQSLHKPSTAENSTA